MVYGVFSFFLIFFWARTLLFRPGVLYMVSTQLQGVLNPEIALIHYSRFREIFKNNRYSGPKKQFILFDFTLTRSTHCFIEEQL